MIQYLYVSSSLTKFKDFSPFKTYVSLENNDKILDHFILTYCFALDEWRKRFTRCRNDIETIFFFKNLSDFYMLLMCLLLIS